MTKVLLSKREKQIASHLVCGLSNKQIAGNLFISERTVKFHCSNIYRKLRINSKLELLSRSKELGCHFL